MYNPSMKKVTLITSFSPKIGGGAVILRSLIPHIQQTDITWVYLHDQDVMLDNCLRVGKPLMGGSLLQDLTTSLFLWLGIQTTELKRIINKILAVPSDIYWIVASNEGIAIATELARLTNTPIHLSVHDDVPFGVFARSRRYRWLSQLAQTRLFKAMQAAQTVDVVSNGMRCYYQQTLGVDTVVIHRYIPCLPQLKPVFLDNNKLVVGHIGSIYSHKEFYLFCQAVKEYAQKSGRTAQIILIGINRKFIQTLQEFSELLVDIPQLAEAQAIQQLAQCHFLYAMYPFNRAAAVFRQTSLPTKLTTYIQAQRPIFAHTPDDSSLSTIVTKYKIGLQCSSLTFAGLNEWIEQISQYELTGNFEKTRAELFGVENVNRLVKCLNKKL